MLFDYHLMVICLSSTSVNLLFHSYHVSRFAHIINLSLSKYENISPLPLPVRLFLLSFFSFLLLFQLIILITLNDDGNLQVEYFSLS